MESVVLISRVRTKAYRKALKSRGSDNISRSRKDAVLPALKENWKTVLMGDADAASRQGVKDNSL